MRTAYTYRYNLSNGYKKSMYQYDNKYTLAKYAAKILTQTKMPKENARKKAVKPKFHGDVK